MTHLALRLRGVGVVRGERSVLDDVDWTVDDGERWAVLGPNGSGKTTLLQVAGAWVLPSRGQADVLGARLGRVDLRDLRARIGYASAALADLIRPTLPVLDLVATAKHGALVRWRQAYADADWERARAVLEGMGCAALADRAFATLSEGERKRVQIARALMANPELLLLDEPAAGLDVGARERLVSRLGALAADPTAPPLVLVTHHVEEIPRAFTHALLLRCGRVVAAGPLDEAVTDAALSACFGLPLHLTRRDGRLFAHGAP